MRPKQYRPSLPIPALSVRHQRLGKEFVFDTAFHRTWNQIIVLGLHSFLKSWILEKAEGNCISWQNRLRFTSLKLLATITGDTRTRSSHERNTPHKHISSFHTAHFRPGQNLQKVSMSTMVMWSLRAVGRGLYNLTETRRCGFSWGRRLQAVCADVPLKNNSECGEV